MSSDRLKLHVVGAGQMGSALISGLIGSGFPAESIYVTEVNKERLGLLKKEFAVATDPESADLTFLVVKPDHVQAAKQVVKGVPTQALISFVAGVDSQTLQSLYGIDLVFRAMPNLAVFCGDGATALWCNQEEHALIPVVQELLGRLGDVISLDKEQQMPLATAILGSGPAFVLKMMAAFSACGEDRALTESLTQMAFQSALALKYHTDGQYDSLCQAIASPGGTTEAGLAILEKRAVSQHLIEVVQSAMQRAEDLKKV